MNSLRKVMLLGAFLLGAPGCATEGFCFDHCNGENTGGEGGSTVTTLDGGGAVFNRSDSGCTFGCSNGGHDGGGKPTCEQTNGGIEICDGKDNDCDGQIDEPGNGTDGIDFSDPHTCGNCATNCSASTLANVNTAICHPPTTGLGTTAGTCDYDTCAHNFYDNNNNRADGCEYYCQWNEQGTNTVDLPGPNGCGIDDDCNGIKDDNLDLCDDPNNCGTCGVSCTLANTESAKCVSTKTGADCNASNTQCLIDKCKAGYFDANGSPDDGCEYPCVPTNAGVEICDGLDNDCDNKVDNADDSLTDPALGVSCQGGLKGVCADTANAGVMKCIDGIATCCDVDSNNQPSTDPNLRYPSNSIRNNVCAGTVGPFVIRANDLQETCNGLDDNCDGDPDNSTVDSGAVCGTGVGSCHIGHTACINGALACPDATLPSHLGELCDTVDNDCDGAIDFTLPKTRTTCTSNADCSGHAPYLTCGVVSDDPNDKACVEHAFDFIAPLNLVSCTASADCASTPGAPYLNCIQVSGRSGKYCAAFPADIVDQTGAPLACDVSPPPPAGAAQPCRPGTLACFGGVPACQGSIKKPLDTDRCNEDTNCDGVYTPPAGVADDPKNCGACGNDCAAVAGANNHSVWQCQAGKCVTNSCQPGFIECGGTAGDCETPCTFDQSAELCDGKDNNCNCQVDEGAIAKPSVIQACGVASGASDPGCNSKVTLACVSGGWKCTFTDPAFCTTGNCTTTPDICDGKDNNCDGVTDADFLPPAKLTGFLGQACFSDDGKAPPGDGPCRTQGTFVCNATGTDTKCSAVKDLSKVSTEICDGIDNNCNGVVDDNLNDPKIGVQCFGGTAGICILPAHAGTQQCVNGAISCAGANLVKPGQVLETCNGLDDDCNGTKDDNLTDTGGSCGKSIGECKAGSNQCVSGKLQCNDVGPNPEVCDGLDNNCNGAIDDNPTDVGKPCNVPPAAPCVNAAGTVVACGTAGATPVPQPCKAGVFSCTGATKVCQGSVVATATTDSCGEDSNCDGNLTNQSGLSNADVFNCGKCGNDCNKLDANSLWACVAGVCQHTGCKSGHIDCDADPKTCEKACTVTSSTESCDNIDNNCDCLVDNNVPAATPVQVCGVSPSATDTGCTSGVTTSCTAGAWKCTFPAGYCTGGNCSTTTEKCDTLDNNCNGLADETFKAPFLSSGFLGQSCTTPAADGPCQGSGSYVCNALGTATTCTAVKDNSKSKPETCNGIDDNCDGNVDNSPSGVGTQCFGGSFGECIAPAHAGTTACQSGSIVCTGANLLKPNQLAETCNNKDDDCDNAIDNNPTDVGGQCGSGIGACVPGTYVCAAGGVKTCQGAKAGTPETCNGVDDNCDGFTDNGIASIGTDCDVPTASAPPATAQCPVVKFACKKGSLACTSGVPVCQGSVTRALTTPDSCCTDENCDGVLTNQPDFQTDIANCGACGNDCNVVNAGKHGVWACVSGVCTRTQCQNGYINCDGVASDCEKPCTLGPAEECNGVDDDCNCKVDDVPVANIPTPIQVCGVSAAASDPKCLTGDGTSGVLVACTAGAWKCTFPTGYCNQGSPTTSCASTTDSCDGKDNNCNGGIDENYKLPVKATGYIGQPCASDDGKPPPGDGACKGTGTYQCSGAAATACNATKNVGAVSTELCDGVDNDCDGSVDETYGAKGTNTTYFVKPAVVKISGTLWTYQYEASRPTATPNSPGNGDGYWCSGGTCTGGVASTVPAGATLDKTHACSVSGKIPWFNVTPVEVEQTCQAAGGFICSTANFTQVCQSSGTCKWGYGTGCTAPANYGGTPFCNLGGYDFDGAASAANTDGLLPGGSNLLNNCWANWAASGSGTANVFDITGNLREITKFAANNYPLMGGAFNTQSDDGALCDFSFYSVSTTFKFSDAGFRCCFSSDPTL